MTGMDIRRLDDGPARPVSPTARGRLVTPAGETPAVWQVPEEAAIAILVNGQSFAVMMATPADLEDFAVGFALTEGLVPAIGRIDSLRIADAADGYVVNLRLDPALVAAVEDRRRTLAGRAGCGLCGAATLEAALPPLPRLPRRDPPHAGAVAAAFAALPDRQAMKQDNRSTHAAAFADADGAIALVREDIGRHNALDKLAGALAREGRAAGDGFVVLSSRLSVEMVQKSVMMGAPFTASVSAPSALALRIAARAGLGVAARAQGGVMMFATDGVADGEAAGAAGRAA